MLTNIVYHTALAVATAAWIKVASLFFVSAELVKAVIQ